MSSNLNLGNSDYQRLQVICASRAIMIDDLVHHLSAVLEDMRYTDFLQSDVALAAADYLELVKQAKREMA